MFTGIIKEVGKVKNIFRNGSVCKLEIEAGKAFEGAVTGDSIAVNGACLTITSLKGNLAVFDVMKETLDKSALGGLKSNDSVNLESSLRSGDSLGGHYVLGHVDCTGKIKKIDTSNGDVSIEIEFPKEFENFLAEKGSIAIDGISLTVGKILDGRFLVHIIPHTLKATALSLKRTGDSVNLEFDILGKYAVKLRGAQKNSKVTEDFLKSKGF